MLFTDADKIAEGVKHPWRRASNSTASELDFGRGGGFFKPSARDFQNALRSVSLARLADGSAEKARQS